MKECTAALVAEYTGAPASGTNPSPELTWITRARGARRSSGKAAEVTLINPTRLVAISGATAAGPGGSGTEKSSRRWTPALLTNVVRYGTDSPTSDIPRRTESGSATSMKTTDILAWGPATASSRSMSRPATITRAPLACRRTARPAPMPELPPVTSTTPSTNRCATVCLPVVRRPSPGQARDPATICQASADLAARLSTRYTDSPTP